MDLQAQPASRVSWWKGARGEWYVVLQAGLFLLVVLGPRTVPGLPGWTPALAGLARATGAALIGGGFLLVVLGAACLGRCLSALPHPVPSARLIETGAFAIVRHPMYSGGICAAFGWGLWTQGVLTLGYAALLLVFFDIKSRREERWLRAMFPDYASYQARVHKLIPFVY